MVEEGLPRRERSGAEVWAVVATADALVVSADGVPGAHHMVQEVLGGVLERL